MPPAPVPTPPAAPDRPFPWKLALAAVAVILLAWGAWAIWGEVNESKAAERWDAIARIQMDRESRDTHDWLSPARPGDAGLRREHVQRLEEQLSKNESDAEIAPYLHFQIANLLRTQILSLGDSGSFEVRRPLYDKALEHVRAIREKYPDWPLNREQFKPPNHRSLTELLLERLTEDRAWDEKHTLRPVEPDTDVVVLLRTTAGDVRLHPFLAEAPKRAKAFLDRACAGGVDCTRAASCDVSCAGDDSCGALVACGGASCRVTCGRRTCLAGITCLATACDLQCPGDDSCTGSVSCSGPRCDVACGRRACTRLIGCAASATCNVSCVADDACTGGIACTGTQCIDCSGRRACTTAPTCMSSC